MKKRIISIALVAVMIVAMIPATIVTAFADFRYANLTAIDTYYGDAEITVDGTRDAVYLNSEKVVNDYTSGSKTGFEAYFVATDDGIYMYADVTDHTIGYEYMENNPNRGASNDVSNHDKLQLYYSIQYGGYSGTFSWGYAELDYFANNKTGEVPDDVNDDTPLHHTKYKNVMSGKTTVETNAVKDEYFVYATTIDAENNKWTAEIFIPWDTAGRLGGKVDGAPYTCGIGLQVNNDDWKAAEGLKAGQTPNGRNGYCYSGKIGTSYYNGVNSTDYQGLKYIGIDEPAVPQYNTYVTTDPIAVDGQLDDIYLAGSHIVSPEYWGSSVNKTTFGFETWTAATLDGFYVYTKVDDTTMNNVNDTAADTGEKVQYYIDWTPIGYRHDDGLFFSTNSRDYSANTTFWGGWIQVDYEGNMKCDFELSLISSYIQKSIVKFENPDWDGVDQKTQYVGYAIEMFIPWSEYMANMVGTQEMPYFGFGVEVHDDGTHNYGKVDPIYKLNEATEDPDDYILDSSGNKKDHRTADQKASGEYRTSICVTPGGMSYYGYEALLPNFNLVYGDTPKHLSTHYGAIVDSATVDGKNTDGEYDGAQVIHVNMAGGGTADEGDIYRIITDGNSVYVLCEIVDTTPSDNTKKLKGGYFDYVDLFFSFGPRLATYASFYRDYYKKEAGKVMVDGFEEDGYIYTYANVRSGYNGGSIKFSPENGNFAVIDNREDGWSFEVKFDLTADEKAQLAAGTLELGFAAQFLDGIDDENKKRNFKYDTYGASDFWNLGHAYVNRFSPVRFVDEDLMNVKAGFSGINVDLSESIDVNVYATLSQYDTDAQMKFTYNDKVVVVGAQATDVANEYKFTFAGLAPQCMGDLVDVELIVDGKVVDSVEDYNLLKYLKGEAVYTEENKALIDALLLYGAAAQKYTNYKTDALVADLDTLVAPTMNKSVKEVDPALDNARFAAAGVHYANINKIFVKVEATDIADITFTATKNGAPIALELAEIAEGVYIAYTDGIKATEFGDVYKFTITDDGTASSQTLTYSVYSYAEAMKTNAKNPNTKTLVNALYNYGVAAEDLK